MSIEDSRERLSCCYARTMDAPAYVPQIRLYQDWLRETRGLHFDGYDPLWRWSVDDLPATNETLDRPFTISR